MHSCFKVTLENKANPCKCKNILKYLRTVNKTCFMLQSRLPIIKISAEKRKKLDEKLKEIYLNVKSRFKKFSTFQDIISKPSVTLHSKDLRDEQIPEPFTRQHVIEPLIDFLGFEITPETLLYSPSGRKAPDYIIRPKNQNDPTFYVEAESLNTDLKSKGQGISQVRSWLISRATKTDYGIATDGLQWVLLKFDSASAQTKVVLKVDLKPIFLKMLNPGAFVNEEEVSKIEQDFLLLHVEYISSFLREYLETIEIRKEEISKKFYNDYVRFVFGYDKNGKPIQGICLLDKIDEPLDTEDRDKNLFAVVFMNRLIFTKFLEEKKIVPKKLLGRLFEKYKTLAIPSTFYQTYLKPLFYEVFNKGDENRRSEIRTNPIFKDIPYLNGGLFTEVVKGESSYNIENEGIELVIDNLLDEYDFSSDTGIDPDILGYIFEKTINFISGTGTNQQNMKGAYYTPDDVVEFIIEKTLTPIIFRKMIQGLRDSGWTDVHLKGYNSIEDILNPKNRPINPMHIRNMIKSIETIRILDPACGSGHFLTAMLSLLLRVKEDLLRSIEEDIPRYQIKRDIISQNIFGVDIDENAIEITRLRLWLSLIEEIEVEDKKQIDTLPNIDYNIIVGNSLVGWFDEKLDVHPLISLLESDYVRATLDNLELFYGKEVAEAREFLSQLKIASTIKAYKLLLGLYSHESGEKAVKIKGILERVRNKLYELISDSYLIFLKERTRISKTVFEELGKNLQERLPFHWRIDFEQVLNDGGFDVIVGNPPYIENSNYNKTDLVLIKSVGKKSKKPFLYHSKNCGNTHAYFTERSIKLLKDDGRFGFIVPLSLVSTHRMDEIRGFIHKHSSEVNYWSFDDRPGKIFSGLEHCRATIIVTEKGRGVKRVNTSKYHRWYTKERPQLFEELLTVMVTLDDLKDVIPKIGTTLEKDILNKLGEISKGKRLSNFGTDEKGERIWFHNAPQYWIHAHTDDHVPKVEYYEGYQEDGETPTNLQDIKISQQYKPLRFKTEHATIVNGLLNSHLFYWWYIIWSDGRHLLLQQINDFPMNLDDFPKDLNQRLQILLEKLMVEYDANANIKINLRSGGYVIRLKEIIPKVSKHIIDQVDDVLTEYFGFDEQQRNYIKSFDLGFRMGT